jgi:hypothetical protein
LDDLFLIFYGSTKQLHKFFQEVNNIHPNIKLTMSHTSLKSELEPCECSFKESIPFLDTECKIKEGKIVTDLYRKPSDRNQYLLTSSCSPASCTENIPFSLALRILRNCSESTTKEIRFQELKELLLERSYRPDMVDAAINRTRTITRAQALKKVDRDRQSRRPVNVVAYDPRLPNIQSIHFKYWRGMTRKNPYLAEVFPEPPLVAFKRQKNIKDYLVRSKVPPIQNRKSQRDKRGMRRCGKQCPACPFVKEGKFIKYDKST